MNDTASGVVLGATNSNRTFTIEVDTCMEGDILWDLTVSTGSYLTVTVINPIGGVVYVETGLLNSTYDISGDYNPCTTPSTTTTVTFPVTLATTTVTTTIPYNASSQFSTSLDFIIRNQTACSSYLCHYYAAWGIYSLSDLSCVEICLNGNDYTTNQSYAANWNCNYQEGWTFVLYGPWNSSDAQLIFDIKAANGTTVLHWSSSPSDIGNSGSWTFPCVAATTTSTYTETRVLNPSSSNLILSGSFALGLFAVASVALSWRAERRQIRSSGAAGT